MKSDRDPEIDLLQNEVFAYVPGALQISILIALMCRRKKKSLLSNHPLFK